MTEHVSKPGESTVEQIDTGQIPEVDITQKDLYAATDDPESWLMYGGGYENQRYTTADVITPDNVDQLQIEWSYEVASKNVDLQGSPLIVPGDPPIMYQMNGPDQTRAINARTGDIFWYHIYQPKMEVGEAPANRGAVVLGDTLYRSTLDLGLLALNRYTGDEKWYFNGAYEYRGEQADGDPQTAMHSELMFTRTRGSSSSFPPVILEGTIVKGSFGGDWGVSGWADGVTVEGEHVWRTSMTPQSEWIGDSWKHGGGSPWQAAAVDPDAGVAVLPSANPGPDFNGAVRPGWNPYTCGKVTVDIESGDVQWNYQESPHDWWDYDSPSPAVVFDADIEGEQRRMVTYSGKTGWVYTLESETGKLHRRSEEFVQHANTWKLPQPTAEDSPWLMPNSLGGTDPQASSYDPERQTLVVKGTNRPARFIRDPDPQYQEGSFYLGATSIDYLEAPPDAIPEWNQNEGVVAGIDPVTGDLKWREWQSLPAWGGAVSTVTGLTFAGTGEGDFIAYQTDTGEKLWQHDLAPVVGDPISWYDPGTKKQYVAIQSGSNYVAVSGEATPQVEDGNRLTVFSLAA